MPQDLIERIIDPLTHLVRNSLDHGVETPDVRIANGKPATGNLNPPFTSSNSKPAGGRRRR